MNIIKVILLSAFSFIGIPTCILAEKSENITRDLKTEFEYFIERVEIYKKDYQQFIASWYRLPRSSMSYMLDRRTFLLGRAGKLLEQDLTFAQREQLNGIILWLSTIPAELGRLSGWG